jgi:hypothetical protein
MSHDNDDTKDAALARIAASGILPGQTYQHYKTRDVYLVIAVGLYEPDLEPLVHYRIADDEYATVWTRQLHVFSGKALNGETLVQRFERVG